MKRVAVIMAGGSGERFWPLSRGNRPKQLLPLGNDGRTLLADAAHNITPMIPLGDVYIVTGRPLRDAVVEAGVVPAENVLAEPAKRNTAGCLAYVAAHLLAFSGESPENLSMTVLTADHRIVQTDAFRESVRAVLETAETRPVLGVVGITPTRPETGYGYIELAENAPDLPDGVFAVERFREKPDAQTAAAYVASGRFLWNSGLFIWRLSTFLGELEQASPVHAQCVREMAAAMRAGDTAAADALFEQLPNISIDFALMEKTRRIVVARGAFDWDDVGVWEAFDRLYPKDADGNVAVGAPVLVDAKDNLVWRNPDAAHVAVAAVGVENLVIVVCGDAVLVMPKDRAQDVREVVARLRENGMPQV